MSLFFSFFFSGSLGRETIILEIHVEENHEGISVEPEIRRGKTEVCFFVLKGFSALDEERDFFYLPFHSVREFFFLFFFFSSTLLGVEREFGRPVGSIEETI